MTNLQETVHIMNEEIDRLNLEIDRLNARIDRLGFQLIQEHIINNQLLKEMMKLKEMANHEHGRAK